MTSSAQKLVDCLQVLESLRPVQGLAPEVEGKLAFEKAWAVALKRASEAAEEYVQASGR